MFNEAIKEHEKDTNKKTERLQAKKKKWLEIPVNSRVECR